MRRKNSILHSDEDENPMSLLTNLFDVAMVFAVALMVAIVSHFNMTEIFSKEDFTMIKNPGKEDMEIITKQGTEIKHYTPSENQQEGNKRGKRVGTAYELENGEIIYIPD
ncbi:MAG: DUF2149 domain-containing protein [Bacteroidales bacterium]|nr:DUF2149 domain-containing protein [Bacteroidales bacterium]MCF0173627.1 DUF2149 domain-containing protein [Bacteroidales bacterium]